AAIESLERLLSTDASQQTVTAVANHTLVLAQLPLIASDALFPAPDAIAETIPGRVGTLRFSSADDVIAAAFLLQLNQIPAPAASQQYVAWVRNSGTNESRFLGALDVINGQVDVTGSAAENLLLGYDELLITLQPVEQGEVLDMATAVYASTFHSDIGIAVMQLIADGITGEPGSLFNAEAQLKIALQHQQFAAESLAAGNLAEAKIHTEHIINILDGEGGEHFGDLNLDGQAQNPGDGVGVRGYWVQVADAVVALGQTVELTSNQAFHADRVLTTSETGFGIIFVAIEQGQRLLASDTVAEAQPFLDEMAITLTRVSTGTDVDNNAVIDPLLGEGGLTHVVDLLLAIHELSVFQRQ
ncbi:MAG: hypothetical protein GY943_07220, partial [Chloroflexi bacterium]|nr:hypothetical protein [Chloroflexota bacterium]